MKKHTIKLTAQEKQQVQNIIRAGVTQARVIKRAQVLLASSNGSKDAEIAAAIGITVRTVENVRKRYAISGLDRALHDAPRPGAQRKLTDKAEARLVALACSEPPEGAQHWTLELLQKRLVKDGVVESISTVSIWQHLTDRGIKPWREKNVVHSQADGRVHRTDGGHP